MTVEQFVATRRERWQRLSDLCDRIDQAGARGLSGDDLDAFAALYRQVASDLAYARAHLVNLELQAWLNRLAARAHGHLYSGRRSGGVGLRGFLLDYPRTWRAAWPFVLSAALLLFGGIVAAWGLVAIDERYATLFVPPEIREQLSPDLTGQIPAGAYVALFDFILINNVTAALLAFATGIFFGIGTIASLVKNGLLIGGLAGVVQQEGLGALLRFWALTFPHGIIELAALSTAGGAGLQLGYALLAGGRTTRQRALTEAGGSAMRLLLGALPWFLLAALIEGFVTPLPLAWPAKIGFALLTGGLLYAYLSGRLQPEPREEPARR